MVIIYVFGTKQFLCLRTSVKEGIQLTIETEYCKGDEVPQPANWKEALKMACRYTIMLEKEIGFTYSLMTVKQMSAMGLKAMNKNYTQE